MRLWQTRFYLIANHLSTLLDKKKESRVDMGFFGEWLVHFRYLLVHLSNVLDNAIPLDETVSSTT